MKSRNRDGAEEDQRYPDAERYRRYREMRAGTRLGTIIRIQRRLYDDNLVSSP
jgi:hypothetical protein